MKIRNYIIVIMYLVHIVLIPLEFNLVNGIPLMLVFVFPLIFLKINGIFDIEKAFDFFVFQLFSFSSFDSIVVQNNFFVMSVYIVFFIIMYRLEEKVSMKKK